MKELAKQHVMIVDDMTSNINLLARTLGDSYVLSAARDGESALEDLALKLPDLILLDIVMPGMSGYEVCRRLKESERTRDIPVIFLTGLTDAQNEAKGLELGAVDYIAKPFNPRLVKTRVRNHLELKLHRDRLEELVRERTEELALIKEATIDGLASLAEYRDPETGGHILRTKNYLLTLATALRRHPGYRDQLDGETVDLLYKSAPLHDIGKVGLPDCILLKPTGLTHDEFEEMKKHTDFGYRVLGRAEAKLGRGSFLACAKQIAWSHHERWDGTGYPRGLAAGEIPLAGRLMALADVYDALISHRVYKPPFSHRRAVEIITQGDGRTMPRHFDPEVLAVFIAQEQTFRRIAAEYADSEEEREVLFS